ncbi:MAG TPA: transglycosylase SLT domain-containing protein [Candidatus Dormibacteraeota bacterium]|nr:transglycosylase SLT domain-containing protein [Candidatus Dormibacteraeota bacterium]
MRVICALACLVVFAAACGQDVSSAQPNDMALPPLNQEMTIDPGLPPSPSIDPNAPPLDLRVVKSMIYAAAVKHRVNPYLVMGLGWWESGWNESAVSSAGAIGVMQIMPATGASEGPMLLRRQVNLDDLSDNIELGAAIIKYNLDGYHGDIVRALTDYYGGPSLVTDWGHLRPDAKRYVWGIYHLAIAFRDGNGPV